MHHPRHANPAGLRNRFEPRCDIDAIAINIPPVLDDVTEIDPYPKLNAAIRRHIGVSLGRRSLHFDRTAHRIDDAGEFDKQSVAGGLDDPASVLLDLGITQITSDRLERLEFTTTRGRAVASADRPAD
jgi:hypothetical protein